MQLTEAEAAFRIQKDELRLRPVWHQKAERVQAHILVCFLAYVLRKTLEGWSQRAGLGRSMPTLLEEFARIQSTDVVVPTTDGRTVRLRCVVRPDKAQDDPAAPPGPEAAPAAAAAARHGPDVVPTLGGRDLKNPRVSHFPPAQLRKLG